MVWQVGPGYFGCRDAAGGFSLETLVERCQADPVRAIEIKLSQGAKPGRGGVLPAAKVTHEIAAIRGVSPGRACLSPPGHSAFRGVDEMLDFFERIADATGLPVGIKSAVGESRFWEELARLMETTGRGVDFITLDGGEGGTGEAPLVYTDHVALPFKVGFARVFRIFAERGLSEQIVFVGSGRLGFPAEALLAFALGCDLVHVAREAMLAVGCIQAQRCHAGRCPTGFATQSRWLVRGLDPTLKAARLANYLVTLRDELGALARSCGHAHPSLVTADQLEMLDGRFGSATVEELFDYRPGWGRPSEADSRAIVDLMTARAPSLGP